MEQAKNIDPSKGWFDRLVGSVPPLLAVGLLMLFSAIMFGLMNSVIRLVAEHSDTTQNVFFRNFMAALFLLPWALTNRSRWAHTKRWGRHFLRSVSSLCGMYLFFTGAELLPLATMVTLTFTMPLFVLIGAALILGEVVRARRWIATAVGFVGVVIVVQPGGDSFTTLSFIPLVAAMVMAISVLLIKSLTSSEDPIGMVFIMSCFASLFSLIPALASWQTPSLEAWGYYVLLGATGVGAHVTMVTAFKLADASLVIPFDYLRLPATAAFAFLFFFEVPGPSLWLGAAVIIGATLYIAQREAVLARQNRSSQPTKKAKENRPL